MLDRELQKLAQQIDQLLTQHAQLNQENQLLQKKIQQLNIERINLREKLRSASLNVKQIIKQLKAQLL